MLGLIGNCLEFSCSPNYTFNIFLRSVPFWPSKKYLTGSLTFSGGSKKTLRRKGLTLPAPCILENKNKLNFLFSHFFVVPQKVLWRPLKDCNGIRTHNHLVRKQTLNHLVKLAQMIELCCECLSVWCIWLCVLLMSHTRFRVNLHSVDVWMSRNSLLETGAISKVSVTATAKSSLTFRLLQSVDSL